MMETGERKTFNIQRALFHLGGGLLPILYLLIPISKEAAIVIIGFLAWAVVFSDYLRLKYPAFNNIFCRIFSPLLRQKESKTIHGSSYYFLSAWLVILFFDKNIAVVSILFLSIGDFLAGVVGTFCGKIKVFGEKTLEGFIAFWVVSLVLALFFFPFRVSIIASFVGALVEILPIPINDNFTIPIASAITLALLI